MLPKFGVGHGTGQRPLSILLLVLLTFVSVNAHRDFGFVFPNATDAVDANQTVVLGHLVDVRWNSPYASTNVGFVAQDANKFVFLLRNTAVSSLEWPVNVNFSGAVLPFYYFYFENAANNSEHFFSALFRVDEPTPVNTALPTVFFSATTTPSPDPESTSKADKSHHTVHTKNSGLSVASSSATAATSKAAKSSTDAASTKAATSKQHLSKGAASSTAASSRAAKSTTIATLSSQSSSVSSTSRPVGATTSSIGAGAPSTPSNDPIADPSNSSAKPQSLSPGSSAGVAIGAVAGAGVLGVLAFLLSRHLRRRAARRPGSGTSGVLVNGRGISPPMRDIVMNGQAMQRSSTMEPFETAPRDELGRPPNSAGFAPGSPSHQAPMMSGALPDEESYYGDDVISGYARFGHMYWDNIPTQQQQHHNDALQVTHELPATRYPGPEPAVHPARRENWWGDESE